MARRANGALLKVVKETGRVAGLALTDTDTERLTMLARWYSLSPEHIARSETDESIWNPDLNPNLTDADHDLFRRRAYAVRRRLSKLSSVEESGTHSGPLVGGGRFDYNDTTWFATPYAVTAVGLPWRLKPSINPQFVRHSWFAADVGLQVERLGHTVVSERELATGTMASGEDIGMDLNSPYTNARTGVTTKKKPDVAVLNPERTKFIAVEVENDTDRTMNTYVEKLKAYDHNAAVSAVWYVCSSQTTANRVGQAATKVFGGPGSFPLRIRVVETRNRWQGIAHLPHDERLMSDLEGMR